MAGKWRRRLAGRCSLAEEGLQAPDGVIESMRLQLAALDAPVRNLGLRE